MNNSIHLCLNIFLTVKAIALQLQIFLFLYFLNAFVNPNNYFERFEPKAKLKWIHTCFVIIFNSFLQVFRCQQFTHFSSDKKPPR